MSYKHNKNNLYCPNCGGSHSLTIYWENSPPVGHCHKCEYRYYKIEELEELMLNSNSVRVPEDKKQELIRGIIAPLEDRNIRKEIAEKYGVEELYNSDGDAYGFMFPHYNAQGEFVSQKCKQTVDKQMKIFGNFKEAQMFGMKAFPSGGKYLTITEGEEDALAAYQMLQDQNKKAFETPVISLNNGAGNGALKECQKNWEYINSFEQIIIAFDGDRIGQETAEKVAKLFPLKAKILKFTDYEKDEDGIHHFKDASDYCRADKGKQFVQLWWKAERYVPKGVKTFRSLWDDMRKSEQGTVVPFPWPALNQMCAGMITGKMDVYKANPKIGKTTLLSELVMHIRDNSPHNVGVIFLENTTREIGLKLCGIKMEEPLDKPGYEIDWDKLKEIHDEVSEEDRIMIFDPEDDRTAENIFNKILYFIKAHDVRYVFLDHASMLAYSSDNQDERKFLDKLFADLKQMTVTHNIYLGVVIHVNDDGKTRGSRAPVQLCDRLFSLERDKLNSDEIVANTTEVIVEENRYGNSGLGTSLFYNQETGRMSELDLQFKMDLKENKERPVEFDD